MTIEIDNTLYLAQVQSVIAMGEDIVEKIRATADTDEKKFTVNMIETILKLHAHMLTDAVEQTLEVQDKLMLIHQKLVPDS